MAPNLKAREAEKWGRPQEPKTKILGRQPRRQGRRRQPRVGRAAERNWLERKQWNMESKSVAEGTILLHQPSTHPRRPSPCHSDSRCNLWVFWGGRFCWSNSRFAFRCADIQLVRFLDQQGYRRSADFFPPSRVSPVGGGGWRYADLDTCSTLLFGWCRSKFLCCPIRVSLCLRFKNSSLLV